MNELEAKPLDIVFKDLRYSVMVPSETSSCFKTELVEKQIIKGVTGICKHGEMTAILGASGAGKTSLLNLLAMRISKSDKVRLEGDILANGRPYNAEKFGEFGNYVMQNDILAQTLTVRECLRFAADLRVNKSEEDKVAAINKLLRDLKLERCADTLVGGPLVKGISGGEKKRTSIAFQLICEPQLIMLDQPTSGLDSFTALVIISFLRKLAEQEGRTVVMTIHQPSNDIFEQFENILLMVEGRLIYQSGYSGIVQYFDTIGFKCPLESNPADFLMSIMHHEEERNVKNYPHYYACYDKQNNVSKRIEASAHSDIAERQYAVGFCYSVYILLAREMRNIFRNPFIFRAKFGQNVGNALISGFIFWKLSQADNVTALFNKAGSLFFIAMSQFMMNLSGVMVTFPLEREVFLKEEGSRLYSCAAYFVSKSLLDAPFVLLFPLLFLAIIYWMIQLQNQVEAFFACYLILVAVAFTGSSAGFLIGSIFNDAKTAGGTINFVILPLVLFSGFFKTLSDFADWIGWLQYLSPIKYSFQAFLLNEFTGQSKFYTPERVMGMTDLGRWECVGILFGLGVGLRIIAFITLYSRRQSLQ